MQGMQLGRQHLFHSFLHDLKVSHLLGDANLAPIVLSTPLAR